MPTFDIVSKTDLAEVDNAVANLMREVDQRYDFKGSKCRVEHAAGEITIHADDEMKLRQLQEMLRGHMTRRGVDAGVLDFTTPDKAAGQSMRQTVKVRQGIDSELARRLVKELKQSKIKVQVAIQGDELRVSGKKRDDLQAAIQQVKGLDVELPLKFINFRD
jgi:hypothetical protein